MFAGQMLSRMPENRLAVALNTALPIAFELRMERELDTENIHMILRVIQFCSLYKIKNKIYRPVIEALHRKIAKDKTLRGTMQPYDAINLFIGLERINWFEQKLLTFIFDVLDHHKKIEAPIGTNRAFLRRYA